VGEFASLLEPRHATWIERDANLFRPLRERLHTAPNAGEAEAGVASIAEAGGTGVALQLDTGVMSSFDAFVADVRAVIRDRVSRASAAPALEAEAPAPSRS
jgi:hypothetical protein